MKQQSIVSGWATHIFVIVASLSIFLTDARAGTNVVTFFNNLNGVSVGNGGLSPEFEETNVFVVIFMRNYHWNGGSGAAAGTIALSNKITGAVYGPWPTTTGINWYAYPTSTIPAGVYAILDSSPGTWSQNETSLGFGFSYVEGRRVTPTSLGRCSIATNHIVIAVNSLTPGASNRLCSADDITSFSWHTLQSFTTTGEAETVSAVITSEVGRQFYRIETP